MMLEIVIPRTPSPNTICAKKLQEGFERVGEVEIIPAHQRAGQIPIERSQPIDQRRESLFVSVALGGIGGHRGKFLAGSFVLYQLQAMDRTNRARDATDLTKGAHLRPEANPKNSTEASNALTAEHPELFKHRPQ